MKKVFICDDTVTGMLSAIYDAWRSCRDLEAGIEFRESVDHQLFCDYIEVAAEERKADAVVRMIKKNLGDNTYWHFYHALLSEDVMKADAVFQTLKEARKIPDSRKIMEHLTNPSVEKVFRLSRTVGNEAHLHIEFIRFRELESGVLYSEISPKNRILTCIGEHFADRFPLENWLIYDKTHNEFLMHKAKYDWVLVSGEEINQEAIQQISEKEKEYSRLWKGFFQTISIKERENKVCQRNHLPMRYRDNMVEFES